jgi:hypothetical protein
MNQFAPCPKCGQSNARQLSFTWWGGAIGPKVLTHVKCESCRAKYNGKTGQSNTTGILIYTLVVGVISFVVFFAVFFFLYSK